jgi:3'(2'), 5'-bisphosphate nucleotidase
MTTPIIQAVQQAAALCHLVQQRHIVASEKTGKEPVTIADYGSQAILGRAIGIAYPDDAILAEEKAAHFLEGVAENQRQQAITLVSEVLGQAVSENDFVRWLEHGRGRQTDRIWAVDPIDGTMGFMAMRRYTIAVGLLVNGQPVEAVMGAPGYPDEAGAGKLFYTEGGKAFSQAMNGGHLKPIHVSTHRSTDPVTAVESFETSHAAHDLMGELYGSMGFAAHNIERLDGQDKYCMVACGDADLYLRISPDAHYRHKSWDHAAGIALVLAAGGRVTDIDNRPITFLPDGVLGNQYVIADNDLIHQNVLSGMSRTLRRAD